MLDLLTKSPLVALRSEGKLHLVDLAGSECAKKGGLIYSEDIGRSGWVDVTEKNPWNLGH